MPVPASSKFVLWALLSWGSWACAQTQPASAAPPNTPAAASGAPQPWTLNQAIVSAQRLHPDWLAQSGMSPGERAELQTRQRALALQIERLWLQALAAQQQVRALTPIAQAAQAGHELAQQMVQVGNWPAYRQQRHALVALDAQAQLQLAQHQAHVALIELWRSSGTELSLAELAQRLPHDLPAHAAPDLQSAPPPWAELTQQVLARQPTWAAAQQQLRAIGLSASDLAAARATLDQATAPETRTGAALALPSLTPQTRWPHRWAQTLQAQQQAQALERRVQADLRIAYSALTAAQALAAQQAERLRLVNALEEDAVQRYNGMFQSTWDLLAATRERWQAHAAHTQAQLQAHLAWADWRAVLDGLPYNATPLSSSNSTAPTSTPGH